VARRSHFLGARQIVGWNVSFNGNAPRLHESGALFVCVFLPIQSITRWVRGCRPPSKQQVGFGKADQVLVSALAASKNASCCRCAKRRVGIRDRDRPLPSSRPLARSLCGHTTRSRLGDAEAGRTPYMILRCPTMRHKPFDTRLMRSYPVSTRINSVVNDDEECSRAVGLVQIQDRLFA